MLARRSKIVRTIGLASDTKEALEQLIRAGMDVALLNFSHGKGADRARRLATLRKTVETCNERVGPLEALDDGRAASVAWFGAPVGAAEATNSVRVRVLG